jgi:hypothetical protein
MCQIPQFPNSCSHNPRERKATKGSRRRYHVISFIVKNGPGEVAHRLRTYRAKAKAAYKDFLALWKDADPDIPILIAAKLEYAKLK